MAVTSEDPEVITRAVESMSRAAAGLAMESVDVWLMISADEDEE